MKQEMDNFNVDMLRRDFPILESKVYGNPLVYFDNAATSQTPRCVVEGITDLYFRSKANVHRGVHSLSREATELMEKTRERVRQFINASSVEEIVFTRGTTEAINLVAGSYGEFLESGDEIILTVMEHHSNIVPWQLLANRKQVVLRVVPINSTGELDMEAFLSLFNERTRFVAVCHVSNVLGTENPVSEIVSMAHSRGVPVLVDGAQAVPHMKVDVQALDVDFYAFSAHKMYGPTGVGVLYGKRRWLEKMPPYQGGGEMIGHVSFSNTTFADLPLKFEAGTPNFVDIAAFHAAMDYVENIGIDRIALHEKELLEYATSKMADIPKMRIFGNVPDKSAVISFLIGNEHHYDIGMMLDKLGIAVRTGHHCAQPLMESLGIEGTVRASFALYNTFEEVDKFINALQRISSMLQ